MRPETTRQMGTIAALLAAAVGCNSVVRFDEFQDRTGSGGSAGGSATTSTTSSGTSNGSSQMFIGLDSQSFAQVDIDPNVAHIGVLFFADQGGEPAPQPLREVSGGITVFVQSIGQIIPYWLTVDETPGGTFHLAGLLDMDGTSANAPDSGDYYGFYENNPVTVEPSQTVIVGLSESQVSGNPSIESMIEFPLNVVIDDGAPIVMTLVD